MELQRGVTGDLAAMKALAAEVQEAGVIDNVRRLCAAARTAGGRVVHCTAAFAPTWRGRLSTPASSRPASSSTRAG
jgi:hypothetical protein